MAAVERWKESRIVFDCSSTIIERMTPALIYFTLNYGYGKIFVDLKR